MATHPPSVAGTHGTLGQGSRCLAAPWGCWHRARCWHCFLVLSNPLLKDIKPTIPVVISAPDVYLRTRTSLCYLLHNPRQTPGARDPPRRPGSGASSPNSPDEAAGPWQGKDPTAHWPAKGGQVLLQRKWNLSVLLQPLNRHQAGEKRLPALCSGRAALKFAY